MFRYRTGCPWRHLPASFGPWSTVWRRDRPGSAVHRRHVTPVTVVTTTGAQRLILLPAMWAAAGLGVTIRMVWHDDRPWVIAGVYSLVGHPDPRPPVFGYHEVFHSLTVLAAALQYIAVSFAGLGATA